MFSKPKTYIIAVLFAACFSAACTTRQGYDTSAYTASPTADAININTASADELERLPHIGPKTAETIIKFRTDNGPFRRPEGLMQIHGISEKRFLDIRPLIRTE